MSIKPKQKLVSVRLNWRKYFDVFCESHGKEPILLNNRLLFRDGWQYSAHDFAGPEYEPPKSERELKALKLRYWTERKYLIDEELTYLEQQETSLITFQTNKSAPLQQTVVFTNDEGKREKAVQAVDFSIFDGRLIWLKADKKECINQIEQLTEEKEYVSI